MLRSNARCRSVRGLSDKRSHPAPRAFRRARAFARRSRLSIRALRGILVGEVARLNPVECVAGERVIIKVAVLRIERDAVRRDLRRTFPLLIDQFFPVDDQLKSWLRFGGFMIVEQSSRFAAYEIDNDDCALAGVSDERFAIGGVDSNVVQITFRGRDSSPNGIVCVTLFVARSTLTSFGPPLTISCIFGAAGSRIQRLS